MRFEPFIYHGIRDATMVRNWYTINPMKTIILVHKWECRDIDLTDLQTRLLFTHQSDIDGMDIHAPVDFAIETTELRIDA